jgi:hypothetical protein
MSVDARESWFLQQVHAGFPLQFPYLQGIALEALLKNVRNVENTPMENHPWDPRFLGERPPSVLRQLLTLCEVSSQHGVKHALMSDAVPSDVKKVEPEEERQKSLPERGRACTIWMLEPSRDASSGVRRRKKANVTLQPDESSKLLRLSRASSARARVVFGESAS